MTRIHCSSMSPKAPHELLLATDIPVDLQTVAVGNEHLPVVVADCDAVMTMYIEAGQGDRDPYWTCLWPSSIALAQELAQRPELVAGKRVCDLGCGLGLGGVAAGRAGAGEVVFLDREPLALQCSLLNAAMCGLPARLDEKAAAVAAETVAQGKGPPELLERLSQALSRTSNSAINKSTDESSTYTSVIRAEVFDWSQPLSSLEGRFDVILACDVLYESFSVEPVAQVAPFLLNSSEGSILLADPPLRAKQNRERFLELLTAQGYVAAEWGQRFARVWEDSLKDYKEVPIEFMALEKGCLGDTVGVKFYNG